MLIFMLLSLTLTLQLLLNVLNRTGFCVGDSIKYVMTLYHLFTLYWLNQLSNTTNLWDIYVYYIGINYMFWNLWPSSG